MNKIRFDELYIDINQRKEQIRAHELRSNSFLMVDEKAKVVISPDHKAEGIEIASKIKALRELNDTESVLLEKAKKISVKYNIPLSDFHQFNLNIKGLERQIADLTLILEEYRKIEPNTSKSKNSPASGRQQMLSAAQTNLSNHRSAQKEIETLLAGGK